MKEIVAPCTIILIVMIGFNAANAQSITVGKPELLYTEDEIPIRYDGTLTTLRKYGNTMYF